MKVRLIIALCCLTGWAFAMWESASRRETLFSKVEKPLAMPTTPTVTPPETSVISLGSPAPSVHSATAVELPDGTIRAYWFGGSREGAHDVAIWSADGGGKVWSAPRVAVDRDLVSQGTRRYIRKLGNPVAHVGADGAVTLFVVSVSLGGWSGSAVNRIVFSPDGKRVVSVNRLVATPLLNLGTLVRGAAVSGGSGEVLLPAYHETMKKFPILLRVGSDGRTLSRGGPQVRGDLFQPWMLHSDAEEPHLHLFLRRGEGKEAKVFHSRHDGGVESVWSDPIPLSVPNPNSGISALQLPDGDFLLAANPGPNSRSRLVILRADDLEGKWEEVYTVDDEDRQSDEIGIKHVEYSYPWLMSDSEGVVHLFYTWNRREIRHLHIGQENLVSRKGGEQ